MPLLARADISLDGKFPWDENNDRTEELPKNGEPVIDAISEYLVKKGIKDDIRWGGIFHMMWNGQTYYTAGTYYVTKEQLDSYQYQAATHNKVPPLPGGGVCSVFVTDANFTHLSQWDIKLPEAGGRTWCNGIDGIGRVKGQDALLVPVSYYLTDARLAKKIENIGDGWRHITVLLRLKQVDGKVVIEQDDRCLGNPNRYPDIPSARKALQKCGSL
jgi:hypothetical protein